MKSIGILVVIAVLALGCFFAGYGIALHPLGGRSVSPENILPGARIIPVSIVSYERMASSSASLSLEYPQFPSLPREFNDAIASSTLGRLEQFKKNIAQNEAARRATADQTAELPPSAYSFIATWQEAQIGSRYVSFVIRFDQYTGGANEGQDLETFNYDIERGRFVALSDLFPSTEHLLADVSRLAREQLRMSLVQASPGYNPDLMLQAGTQPTAFNFRNFTFTEYAVTFYFPKYAVAPGAFGEQRVTLPFSSLR